ncbi:hypothetical protein L1987_59375 [Smallanthus sonchifolius]|uniref:Uncharacterized protein n=1 Tax=Smallanthus sonchifolius TaxID=185202 RepID=A0ACB9D5T4_9ASTR|nr:hypothetical protein L1987_59375 [Smallanthus sonchifolius]
MRITQTGQFGLEMGKLSCGLNWKAPSWKNGKVLKPAAEGKLTGNLVPRGTRRTWEDSLAVRERQNLRFCLSESPRGTRELAGKSLAVRERPGFPGKYFGTPSRKIGLFEVILGRNSVKPREREELWLVNRSGRKTLFSQEGREGTCIEGIHEMTLNYHRLQAMVGGIVEEFLHVQWTAEVINKISGKCFMTGRSRSNLGIIEEM